VTGDRIVLAERVHKLAPPPWRVFEALTNEIDRWLVLRPREVTPEVVEAVRPSRVVWGSLWPVSPDDRVEFSIEANRSGSALRFCWSTTSPPDERAVGLVRHRLNEAIGGQLRHLLDTEG
jgi:uncharacterized protein YndB with AHSA1/START domain